MLPYFITYLCLSFNPIYNQACNSALNAASIQINLKQDLDVLQQNIETEVEKRTGKEIWIATLTGYQMIEKETLMLNINSKPFADSISTNINRTSSTVTLTWLF